MTSGRYCMLAVLAAISFVASAPYQPPSAVVVRPYGTVTAADETPVADATVVLQGTQTFSTSSDANGAYSFENIPAGYYTVIVTKAGFMQYTPRYSVAFLPGYRWEWNVTLLQDTGVVTVRDKHAFFDYLKVALDSRGAVRLDFAGACDPAGDVDFPPTALQLPVASGENATAIRSMLRGDPNVTVMQGGHGITRITIGTVNTTILQTRLRTFKLTPEEQYDGGGYLVLGALLSTREVTNALSRRGLRWPGYVFDYLLSPIIKGAPHLPSEMSNVTVSFVLDSIARVFNGVVMYEECRSPDGKGFANADFLGLSGA